MTRHSATFVEFWQHLLMFWKPFKTRETWNGFQSKLTYMLITNSICWDYLGQRAQNGSHKGREKERREKEAGLLIELSWIPFNTFCRELMKAFFPAERLKALFKNWHPPSAFMNSLIKILAKSHITHTSTSNSIR